MEALTSLRRSYPDLVLTAVLRASNSDDRARSRRVVTLLDAGADDVVQPTIEPSEYAARIRAMTRRRGWPSLGGSCLPTWCPRLDLSRRRLIGRLGDIELTRKEYIVMRVLLENTEGASRLMIGEQLWTDGWYGTKKAIDMHVANLRRKLHQVSGSEWSIETIRGTGFVLVSATVKAAG